MNESQLCHAICNNDLAIYMEINRHPSNIFPECKKSADFKKLRMSFGGDKRSMRIINKAARQAIQDKDSTIVCDIAHFTKRKGFINVSLTPDDVESLLKNHMYDAIQVIVQSNCKLVEEAVAVKESKVGSQIDSASIASKMKNLPAQASKVHSS